MFSQPAFGVNLGKAGDKGAWEFWSTFCWPAAVLVDEPTASEYWTRLCCLFKIHFCFNPVDPYPEKIHVWKPLYVSWVILDYA